MKRKVNKLYKKDELIQVLTNLDNEVQNNKYNVKEIENKITNIINKYKNKTEGNTTLDNQDIVVCFIILNLSKESITIERSNNNPTVKDLEKTVQGSLEMLKGHYFDREGIPGITK